MAGLECVRSQIVTARFASASQSAPGDSAIARTNGPGHPGRLPAPGSHDPDLPDQHHRKNRCYEEGPLEGPLG
jgi:hypothetical protein